MSYVRIEPVPLYSQPCTEPLHHSSSDKPKNKSQTTVQTIRLQSTWMLIVWDTLTRLSLFAHEIVRIDGRSRVSNENGVVTRHKFQQNTQKNTKFKTKN